MFDFEKLIAYQKAKEYNKNVVRFLAGVSIDKITHDQLRRASFSIMLNIAEGRHEHHTKTIYIIYRVYIYIHICMCV